MPSPDTIQSIAARRGEGLLLLARQLAPGFGVDPDAMSADEYGAVTIKQVGDDYVLVVPMIYNDRVVISDAPQYGYDHAWCFDKGAPAIVAALVWDPDTQDEPLGYKKKATAGRRKAPQ